MDIFCTRQQLSLLHERDDPRRFLSGESFWRERHGLAGPDGKKERPWKPWDREAIVQSLSAGGDVRLLAVVCAAGLGKTTNLEWMFQALAGPKSRQVPLLFRLDGKTEKDRLLPTSEEEFRTKTLVNRIRNKLMSGSLSDARLLLAIERLREQGRITLLFDSIDQASATHLAMVREILDSHFWDSCPIVVSARPHAIYDRWKGWIEASRVEWRFARVEPLDVEDRRLLLGDLYDKLPPGGQDLMANPRNIEYVRDVGKLKPGKVGCPEPNNLDDLTLADLTTSSHVFAGAMNHQIKRGFASSVARKLDRPNDEKSPASSRQVYLAFDLFGALAYSMYCLPAPGSKDGDKTFRPNVSYVPKGRGKGEKEDFLNKTVALLQKSGCPEYASVTRQWLDDNLLCLSALNAAIHCDLIDEGLVVQEEFRWYDRSLQEFFAAYWLSRYAGEVDRKFLRQWRYADPYDWAKKSLFGPLWGLLADMPMAARRDEVWSQAVGVLFEHKVERACEMIYRAWPRLTKTVIGRVVIAEWQRELWTINGTTAKALREKMGFRPCPPEKINMPPGVQPFVMQEFPVTNEEFELFDNCHEINRWLGKHPAGSEAPRHPVVNINFFQAWTYAQWVGCRIPTEEEWEFACRAGTKTDYWFGNAIDYLKCNCEKQIGQTTTRSEASKNPWGLYDMHGNVWEWCDSFYESGDSDRVLRGGSWYDYALSCCSGFHSGYVADEFYHDVGFRLIADLLEPGSPRSRTKRSGI